MTTPTLVLATDLDGTFLGGSAEQRARLYDWIAARRDAVSLIFVTGRDLPHVRHLCTNEGVPWPDYVIGDVGTTVVELPEPGSEFAHVEPIEAWIAQAWGDAGDRVRALLADEPGLELQPTPFRYRVSYDWDPDAWNPEVAGRIEAVGLDCLTSARRFLDVLPKGISKGPTLQRLVAHLGLPDERVLVAGDTLNDLSLFRTGLSGVAVGNSEAALVERVADLPNVYLSSHPGAAGISDAIAVLGKAKEAAE
jgi:hydroxymethylpyrimidine pyrophosphatase-like HAD family hydrolase